MEKKSEAINNICTILGGALLLYPLIEQATQELSQFSDDNLKMLGMKEEPKKEHEQKETRESDEIAELKRKLAEYEEKKQEVNNEYQSE